MARVSTTFGHDDAHSPGGSMNQSRQRRFSPLAITLFCLVGAALIILAGLSALKAMQTANSYAEVVRVENGRTVVLSIDGHEESVQLKGILTPQLPAEGEEPGAANCLAQESTDALTGLLPEGTRVQVEQIDRAAADGPRHAVIRHAGQLVNVQQVSRGLAAPDVGAGVDDGLAEDLRQAQSEARQGARGLYSADVPCSLTAQVTGALAALEGLPEPDPDSVEQADERIEQVRAAVDQGLAAQKTISGIVAAPGSLPALTWADEVPGLRGRIDEALDAARAGLAQLKDARQDLVATQRAAEKAAERERELARQEAARREAAAQAERERERARAAQERAERERAEERRRASQSASASPSETASPSPTESPTPSESPSPEPTSTPEPTPPPTPTSTPTQTPKPTPSTSSEPEPTVTPTPSDAGSDEED